MNEFQGVTKYIGAVSFEERSLSALRGFLGRGGSADVVKLGSFASRSTNFLTNLGQVYQIPGIEVIECNRLSSRSLWNWVWEIIRAASGDIVIDASCLPREILAMLLFAASIRRNKISSLRVIYVSASEGGYATQNNELKSTDRWLSRGVIEVRSILGFPGDFQPDRQRHVIAFAGHEFERLHESIVCYEPDKLSIANESRATSTVGGADCVSRRVVERLQREIPLPDVKSFSFSAKSIEETYVGISQMHIQSSVENIAFMAMNTKLSFLGAVFYALQDRGVRLVYSVPSEYNSNYSRGSGEFTTFDVSDLLFCSNTPLALD